MNTMSNLGARYFYLTGDSVDRSLLRIDASFSWVAGLIRSGLPNKPHRHLCSGVRVSFAGLSAALLWSILKN
jgi:hypothetical protein